MFGRSPSVAIKELKRNGYPLSKVVGFVWGSAEADVEAAGGWSVAEGYHTIQFAGVGNDYPVRHDIVEMYVGCCLGSLRGSLAKHGTLIRGSRPA